MKRSMRRSNRWFTDKIGKPVSLFFLALAALLAALMGLARLAEWQ